MRIEECTSPDGSMFHVYRESEAFRILAEELVRQALRQKLPMTIDSVRTGGASFLAIGPLTGAEELLFRARWAGIMVEPKRRLPDPSSLQSRGE